MVDISISQIKKLGREIRRTKRDGKDVSDENLEKLQNYRVLHQPPMRKTFDFLVDKSRKLNKANLVVYRLKRMDTVIRKIERYSSMDLSKMQDIAGCRSILYTENQIYSIVNEFKRSTEYEIIEEYDYIAEPRDTGYRSYHLVVRPVDSNKVVEIQLRTREMHQWATLVEITDILYKVKLKEGEDHRELYKFHKYLSRGRENLTYEEKADLIDIAEWLNIIQNLIDLFKGNYFVSVERWANTVKSEHKYIIMELDMNNSPVFTFFDSFEIAEKHYFSKFTQREPEMVLIHTNQPDLERLEMAYSNYVLLSHPSIRTYLNILADDVVETKKNRQYSLHKDLRLYFWDTMEFIIVSFENEQKKFEEIVLREKNEDIASYELYESWAQNLEKRISFLIKLRDDTRARLIDLRGPNIFERLYMFGRNLIFTRDIKSLN